MSVLWLEAGNAPKDKDRLLYANHWGELFFRRFNSPYKFKKFIDQGGRIFARTEMHYYVGRNNLYYEKIIERSKELVHQIFSGIAPVGS